MSGKQTIHVEVAYALPHVQRIVPLELPEGATVHEAVQASALDKQFPELDLATVDLGVFGKVIRKPEEEKLAEGDRIEIYRPLIADPKEVRKQRAAKVKARKAAEQ
jgi:uncharacterized protein